MQSIPKMADEAWRYYRALTEAGLPDALAVEIVFDFMKRVHAGDEPDAAAPSRDDVAAAAAAKRAQRQAEIGPT